MPDPTSETPGPSSSSDPLSKDGYRTLTEDEEGHADSSFIDDLIAANDMKSYILAAGHELAEQVISDLNQLYSIFKSDIEVRRAGIEGEPFESSELSAVASGKEPLPSEQGRP